MRAVVQRVNEASVTVEGRVVGRVGVGFLVLLGVTVGDTEAHARLLAAKVAKLRVFKDDAGKMNRSLQDIKGSALVVSQFTLYADTAKGNRPSFIAAAPPEMADELYRLFCREMEAQGIPVEKGVFGADMKVALVNDGPVTICLDTDAWKV
ncbi:MAG: D-tyrosyl-tRNA(Tyr) deacylase [Planctomycetaceae bacterium]|nr:D-tyrosyl-tRNA(Tyr) deacylase [Planctomycetaceae bacterium]